MDSANDRLDEPAGAGRDLGIQAGSIDRAENGGGAHAGRPIQKIGAQVNIFLNNTLVINNCLQKLRLS